MINHNISDLVKTEKADCCGCLACLNSCPVNAISAERDNEGFLYPDVDNTICINCGKCVRNCPEVQPCKTEKKTSKIFACYRKNLPKRLNSQSGGVFALLAEYVLNQNGVVFGAAFDDNWVLAHKHVNSDVELINLLGSKYIQSDIGLSYTSVKRYLEHGIITLFSGTPCQIQGLKRFLGKDYLNLLTVDLICHGVSSPEVWSDFLAEISKGDTLIGFKQKDKTQNDSSVFSFEHRAPEVYEYADNPFTKGFIENLFLRPSCYQCSFKGINRCSDITLGDFWGIEQFYPDFGDQYGISAVIIHSEKGEEYFKRIQNDCERIECDSEMLIKGNPCMVDSVPLPGSRNTFFKLWKKRGVISTVNQVTNPSYQWWDSRKRRILRVIKRVTGDGL